MQFCPTCKFLLYTKLDNETNNLINYCKNCSWNGSLDTTSNCIYKRNYQEDYIVDRVISNKYTIFDNTLPRVAFNCPNENCATNISNINIDNSFIINGIPIDISDNDLEFIYKNELDNIKTVVRMKLSSLLIEANDVEQRDKLISQFRDMVLEGNKLSISEYSKPKKEVLYIKYDNINMKYLYICAVCGTSWKKN